MEFYIHKSPNSHINEKSKNFTKFILQKSPKFVSSFIELKKEWLEPN